MKFNNGCWLKKKGIESFSPEDVWERSLVQDNTVLRLYAPAHKVYNRGCTLGGVTFTINVRVPVEGVYLISLTHFEGDNDISPSCIGKDIYDNCKKLNTSDDLMIIYSGNTRLEITDDVKFTFYRGDRYLTCINPSDIIYVREDGHGDAYIGTDDVNYIGAATNIAVDEHIYGLGERFGPLVKNGQSVVMWNEDGGTSTELSYKNVPFYMSDRGYGVFVNNTGRVEYEVGSELVRKCGFSVRGEQIEFAVICAGSSGDNRLKEVLSSYTELTGRVPVLPKWSFGLWLSTSFTTDYNEETVIRFIDGMIERKIPLSVFHFDCFWMRGMSWCNFMWDRDAFPDPEGMLSRIRSKGIKVCVWINPYIAQNSELFHEGLENGYFIKKNNGKIWQWDMWQPGMAIVDFTNPAAKEWYQSHLERLLDMGVDCFKTDFGERIPYQGVTYYDGSSPEHMHNYYAYMYNQTVYEVILRKRGEGEAVLFARSACAGGQKFPVHWGGDCTSDYESMAESLRGGLSLMMSGFSFWSHDIGGFEDRSSEDVYKRWVAFGLLSSHSRMHGSSSYRVPWNYGDEAVETARKFACLKNRLMPYIYSAACEAHETGVPVVRTMILEFPDDPNTAYLDKQYMLGDSILVAPVFNDECKVILYLPEGKWTYYYTNEVYEGGRYIVMENISYNEIPLFVREGAAIPIGECDSTPEYDYTENIRLHLYQPCDNYSKDVVIHNETGHTKRLHAAYKVGASVAADDGIDIVVHR